MNPTFLVQLAAVLAFAGCFVHSWRSEGQRAAQQWFFIGYLFALLLVSLLVVIGQIAYNPGMLAFGAAPSLTIMFYPAIFYAAYTLAKRYVEPTQLRAMGYLVLIITPWLTLPLDALAVAWNWWSFPTESYSFLNGIPFYVPFAWGITSAAFYLMVARIRKIRFRGNGQFFAMIIASPLLAGLTVLLIALIQVIVDTLAVLGGQVVLYVLLAVFFLLLPLAFFLDVPRITNRKSGLANRR